MDERFTVILANAAIWFFRFWYETSGVNRDFLLILPFGLWALRLYCFPLFYYFIPTTATVNVFGVAFLLLNDKLHLSKRRYSEEEVDHDTPTNSLAATPLIFPCRTAHTRMFPKKHSFSYSYLFTGIPIGWQGSVGSFLSADLESLPTKTRKSWLAKKSWFSVEAEDHLSRGIAVDGLKGKLEAYLKSQVGESRLTRLNVQS